MNTLGKIIAVIASLFVFFVLPVSYHAQKQDALHQVFIQNTLDKFVNDIKCSGTITGDRYLAFIQDMDTTGNLYEVKLDHAHLYTEPQLDENGAVTGYYEYYESTYDADILDQILNGGKTYYMSQGDYISVSVVNRTETYAEKMEKMFFGIKTGDSSIFATAGGRIRDETRED